MGVTKPWESKSIRCRLCKVCLSSSICQEELPRRRAQRAAPAPGARKNGGVRHAWGVSDFSRCAACHDFPGPPHQPHLRIILPQIYRRNLYRSEYDYERCKGKEVQRGARKRQVSNFGFEARAPTRSRARDRAPRLRGLFFFFLIGNPSPWLRPAPCTLAFAAGADPPPPARQAWRRGALACRVPALSNAAPESTRGALLSAGWRF